MQLPQGTCARKVGGVPHWKNLRKYFRCGGGVEERKPEKEQPEGEAGAELGKSGFAEDKVGQEREPVNTPAGLALRRWPWPGQCDQEGRIRSRKGWKIKVKSRAMCGTDCQAVQFELCPLVVGGWGGFKGKAVMCNSNRKGQLFD